MRGTRDSGGDHGERMMVDVWRWGAVVAETIGAEPRVSVERACRSLPTVSLRAQLTQRQRQSVSKMDDRPAHNEATMPSARCERGWISFVAAVCSVRRGGEGTNKVEGGWMGGWMRRATRRLTHENEQRQTLDKRRLYACMHVHGGGRWLPIFLRTVSAVFCLVG